MATEIRVIKEANLRMGGAQGAGWYSTVPIPGFSDWTAKELVESGPGEEVIEYFKAVDAGVFA